MVEDINPKWRRIDCENCQVRLNSTTTHALHAVFGDGKEATDQAICPVNPIGIGAAKVKW